MKADELSDFQAPPEEGNAIAAEESALHALKAPCLSRGETFRKACSGLCEEASKMAGVLGLTQLIERIKKNKATSPPPMPTKRKAGRRSQG